MIKTRCFGHYWSSSGFSSERNVCWRIVYIRSYLKYIYINRCLLEDDENYMFRPLLVIFRFLIRKKYMLEDCLYKVLSNIYIIDVYWKMIKTTCFGHYWSSSGFSFERNIYWRTIYIRSYLIYI